MADKCWKCEGEAELVVYRRAREPKKYPACTACIVRIVEFLSGPGSILVERVKP